MTAIPVEPLAPVPPVLPVAPEAPVAPEGNTEQFLQHRHPDLNTLSCHASFIVLQNMRELQTRHALPKELGSMMCVP